MFLRAREAVLCVFILAKRDLPITGDGDTLDVSCPDIRHISFGHRIHLCSGAPLARLELAASCRTMLDRCQSMTLAAAPAKLVRRPTAMTRRLPTLKLEFTKALADANAV
jgi:cytochrome P450